jgi:hypothetical protein
VGTSLGNPSYGALGGKSNNNREPQGVATQHASGRVGEKLCYFSQGYEHAAICTKWLAKSKSKRL